VSNTRGDKSGIFSRSGFLEKRKEKWEIRVYAKYLCKKLKEFKNYSCDLNSIGRSKNNLG
jgi:hypothetical protein